MDVADFYFLFKLAEKIINRQQARLIEAAAFPYMRAEDREKIIRRIDGIQEQEIRLKRVKDIKKWLT